MCHRQGLFADFLLAIPTIVYEYEGFWLLVLKKQKHVVMKGCGEGRKLRCEQRVANPEAQRLKPDLFSILPARLKPGP
jgi:hypothetical protein